MLIKVKVQAPVNIAAITSPPTASSKRKRLESLGARQKRQKLDVGQEKKPIQKVVSKAKPNLETRGTRKPLLPKSGHLVDDTSSSKRVDKNLRNDFQERINEVCKPDAQASCKSGEKRKAGEDVPRASKMQKLEENRRKPVGLYNFHRACYQNSIFQCLSEIPELVEYLRPKRFRVLDNAKLRAFSETNLAKIRGIQSKRTSGTAKFIHDTFQKSKALM